MDGPQSMMFDSDFKVTFLQFYYMEILWKSHCCDEWAVMESSKYFLCMWSSFINGRAHPSFPKSQYEKVSSDTAVWGKGTRPAGATLCAVFPKHTAKWWGQALQWTPALFFIWTPATFLSLDKDASGSGLPELSSPLGPDFGFLCSSLHWPVLARILLSQFR